MTDINEISIFVIHLKFLIMRILAFLFTSILILGLNSCSSNDDGNNEEVTLLGKWNVKEMTMEGNFTEDGMPVSFEGIANEMDGNNITFNENNSFTGNTAPFDMEITFRLGGFPTTMTQPISQGLPVAGEWTKEGNTLFLTEAGSSETTKYTIESHDATTLILSGDQNSINIEDIPADAVFSVRVTLKR